MVFIDVAQQCWIASTQRSIPNVRVDLAALHIWVFRPKIYEKKFQQWKRLRCWPDIVVIFIFIELQCVLCAHVSQERNPRRALSAAGAEKLSRGCGTH